MGRENKGRVGVWGGEEESGSWEEVDGLDRGGLGLAVTQAKREF